jgi:DNA (cytosine-5)-methyltransferase 1
MATMIETKVGNHRGKPRIYLEGIMLEREGFTQGIKYSRSVTKDKLKLTVIEGGQYKVSKKSKQGRELPVIDIRTEALNELAVGGRVRVLITNKTILVLRHFNDERIADRMKLLIENMEKNDIRTGSFFHGGGIASKGFHEGLAAAGVQSKTALAIELESSFINSSLKNNPELWDDRSIVINSGIESVRFHKPGIPQLNILEAGIPCSGASKAGISSLGLSMPEEHPIAGAAFHYMLQGIDATNPAIFTAECVPGYRTTAGAVTIRSVLGQLGYSIQEKLVRGSNFGAFEDRERWLLVATTVGLEEIINLEDIDLYQKEVPASFSEIKDETVDENAWKDYQYLRDKEVRDIEAGKGFRMQKLNDESQKCGTITRGYNKVRSCDPILEREDGKLRLFSVSEHAKAKCIPVGTVEGLPATTAHQILGQSVIYHWYTALGQVIGKAISDIEKLKNVEKHHQPFEFAFAS